MESIIIVVASALAAVLLDAAFYADAYPGIVFFLIHLVLAAAAVLLWNTRRKTVELSPLPLVWVGLSLLLSPWLFVRDSGWLYVFNMLTPVVLMSLFFVNVYKKNIHGLLMDVSLPLKVLRMALTKMGEPLRAVLDRIPGLQGDRQKWIKGFILAFPILLVVFLLLYSADKVFAQYTDAIVDIETIAENIGHLFTVLYFFVFSGLLYSVIRKHDAEQHAGVLVEEKNKYVLRMLGVLVGVLLFAFSWIQLKYLFLNPSSLENLGIGFQQYAHQGFYQLVVVAFIVFSVIWLLAKTKTSHGIDSRLNKFDTGIALVLMAEILLLLASAIKRLSLFVDALEWAPRRFFAIEGMVFFAIIMVVFIVHLFVKKFTRHQFLFAFTVLFTINILFLNIFNPDQYIAEQNVARYVDEGGEEHELDFDYSSYVSADGIEEGIYLYENARTEDEKQRAKAQLRIAWFQLKDYNEEQEQKWYVYHISKQRAYNMLTEYHPDLIKEFEEQDQLRKKLIK